MQKSLYSVEEFCSVCGISRALFYKLVKQNLAPALVKIGRRTFIRHEAYEGWLLKLEQRALAPHESGIKDPS